MTFKKKRMKRKDIFEFNHIDISLDSEKIKEIMDFHKHYHKKSWVYKSSYSRKKKINMLVNLLSLTLASVGVISQGELH